MVQAEEEFKECTKLLISDSFYGNESRPTRTTFFSFKSQIRNGLFHTVFYPLKSHNPYNIKMKSNHQSKEII